MVSDKILDKLIYILGLSSKVDHKASRKKLMVEHSLLFDKPLLPQFMSTRRWFGSCETLGWSHAKQATASIKASDSSVLLTNKSFLDHET